MERIADVIVCETGVAEDMAGDVTQVEQPDTKRQERRREERGPGEFALAQRRVAMTLYLTPIIPL